MPKHIFDPASDFCTRCGKALCEEFDKPQPCRGGEIFAAISHIRSRARAAELVFEVLGDCKCPA